MIGVTAARESDRIDQTTAGLGDIPECGALRAKDGNA